MLPGRDRNFPVWVLRAWKIGPAHAMDPRFWIRKGIWDLCYSIAESTEILEHQNKWMTLLATGQVKEVACPSGSVSKLSRLSGFLDNEPSQQL